MAWTNTQTTQETSGSGTSAQVSFASAVTSGNIVCVFAFCNNVSVTNTITSVVDDKGNTYSYVNDVGVTGVSGTWNTAIFWSGARLTNGPITITVNNSVSQGNLWINIDEFTPPAGTIGTDTSGGTGSDPSTPTTATTSAFTTTKAGDLIYAATFNASAATTAGAGFTGLTGSGTDQMSEFLSQVSAGSTTATFGLGTGAAYTINALALSATGSKGGTLPLMGVGHHKRRIFPVERRILVPQRRRIITRAA
jgi:hypothetical protein